MIRASRIMSWTWVLPLALLLQAAQAADLEREKRLAEQTVDAILDGEPVFIEAGGHAFLAIHTGAETASPAGAAIILHGRGMHPDWAQVAGPLRIALPASGWTTLSLQMPVLEKDATYYDYLPLMPEAVPRIDAAIAYLRELGYSRIALISHSCGVHMAMHWVSQRGDSDIDAFVGIGMGATDYRQPMPEPFPLEQISVPLLNVHGSNDYPAVQKLAAGLGPVIGKNNSESRQVVIEGADHYFEGFDSELAGAISDWLNGLTRKQEKTRPVQ